MKLPEFLRTTAIRLAVYYTLIYALILGLALLTLAWSTSQSINARKTSHNEGNLVDELHVFSQIYENKGRSGVSEIITLQQQGALKKGRFYLFVTQDNQKLAGNLHTWPTETPLSFDSKVHNVFLDNESIPQDLDLEDVYWPTIAREFPDGTRLLLTRSIEQNEDLLEITDFLIEFSVVAILLALLMGATLSWTILRRINTINNTTNKIMMGDLSQRIPLGKNNDEFDFLATQLNTMLDRIQQLIKGMREVTDNVAHDLRSPLSRIQNRLEVTLLKSRDEEEYRDVIKETIVDTESLISTFNALLEIAQTEAGSFRGEWAVVNLSNLANELAGLYSHLAREQGKHLSIKAGENIEVIGNHHLLAQALNNLLDNAIKYTLADSLIELQVAMINDKPTIIVSDNGLGIPADQYQTVLERYSRLDSARNHGGNGLGLSLIKAVADLHQASLKLEDNDPGLKIVISFKKDTQLPPS